MRATSFLLGIFLLVSSSEMLRVLSSDAAAALTLATLSKANCDPLKARLACLSSPYRTIDGTCNNLCRVTLGAANTPLIRFPDLAEPTAYGGVNFEPRAFSVASDNVPIDVPLPNARDVSVTVFESAETDLNGSAPDFTHLTMTWGQFLDHDVTLTELTPNVDCGVNADPCSTNPDCIGIDILAGQQLGGNPGAVCIPLRRSFRNSEGEQINIITHYVDGSQVYGSDCETAKELRDMRANLGFLDVRPYIRTGSLAQPILPPQEEGLFCRSDNLLTEPCLRGGDERVNENQALTVMHTIWVREHNRVALALHVLNPYWDDERLYQEARKIVIAELQHITYNEWLAVLFDETVRANAGILLSPPGTFFTGYNPHVSPAIFNSFSTAAFRMGHTLIRDVFRLDVRGMNDVNDPVIEVNDFFNPSPLFQDFAEQNVYGILLRGLFDELAHQVDGIFTAAVREELLIEGPGNGITGDLPAINVQRGRDHGLPAYLKFVKACGENTLITTFDDLHILIPTAAINKLKLVYSSPFDIDLWTGAIVEFAAPGSALGFTFTCLFTQQMKNLRFGDRFWYERDDHEVAFTAEQLASIRNVTLARIICDNADDVNRIQPKAFLEQSRMNARIGCIDIPIADLTPFKEDDCPPEEESSSAAA